MSKTQTIEPLMHDKPKAKNPDVHECPDCDRTIHGHYQYAMHRAFKHNDFAFLEEWYLKHKGIVPWWVKE